ncbi:DNA polymerase III subunit [Filimonas effusa]|uniref:DNA polymerase III subunit delta n=1 Tax=Filimonas effusa TaxID=2508721 RepID=A0A4Q1D212_9BACT|nr:DNA polymerase III subunit delta' [Filimonas effusa]RXK81908.1 DNA polymerase III subunit delta' [Filimonas effusa]
MQFQDVIGQHEVKQHLAEIVQHNRLSHALLFLGKEGSGVLPLALAFAQYVTCTGRSGKSKAPAEASLSMFGEAEAPAVAAEPLSDACGVCPACIKAKQLIHPDIHFSYPVIPKKSGDKPVSSDYATEWRSFLGQQPYGNAFDWLQSIGAENKQGNITADECNDILRKLSLKSFESEYKILVMWMPEYLGKEGNKLLKLIEEPPPNTLFVLVAENEEQILATILSRCQLVKVPLLESSDIENGLMQRNGTAPEQARQVAGIAEGNYREALQLLQHAGEDWQALLRDWLNATLKGGPAAQVKWIEEVSRMGREKQKQFLRYFNHLLEQSIRIRVMGAEKLMLSDQDKDFAQRLNKIAGVSQQQVLIEELDKAAYYIERNANAKMLFHALTIKLYHIIQDKALILAE